MPGRVRLVVVALELYDGTSREDEIGVMEKPNLPMHVRLQRHGRIYISLVRELLGSSIPSVGFF